MAIDLSILQAVKQSISEATKKITYKFENSLNESRLRCPNVIEQKNWLLSELRILLFDGKITTQQYRSIKGEIRKHHFDVVFNFMDNRGVDNIRERFEKYSTTKLMYDAKVKVTFPEPVEVTLLEIKVENKGGSQ